MAVMATPPRESDENLILRSFHIAPSEDAESKGYAKDAGVSWSKWVREAVRDKLKKERRKRK